MSADEILEALDPDQREVALALRGPVCILAGAGTGKTRAITHRIAYGVRLGVYGAPHVLAVTFTARAAGEMRTRLRSLGVVGVQARTFHAAALRQLSFFWPRAIGGAAPRILEHKAKLVADAASGLGLDVDRVAVRDLASEIEWAKVSLLTPDEYSARAEEAQRATPAGYTITDVARLMTAYEEAKTAQGVMDFEDVLILLTEILRTRPEIADEVRRQYRHFVVDEFQDVSPLQYLLLGQWLGDRKELCVVGDPSQTIYSFTGASSYYLQTFAREHQGATTIKLVRDYRSTPQIVALANRLLQDASGPKPLQLISQLESGATPTFGIYDDDDDEARAVATRIRELVAQDVPAADIAVLYRTNSQSQAIESALSEAGIGYIVRGSDRFFDRREIKELLVLLRTAARTWDPAELTMPAAVRDCASEIGWTAKAPQAAGAVRDRWESLQAVVALAEASLEANKDASVADFVAELDDRINHEHPPQVQGVTLASLHAAKGLEWEAVFLIGLSDGLMPISLADTEPALAEEKRLLYVGITRAKRWLHLSYARGRAGSGRASRRGSRFLAKQWLESSRQKRRAEST